MPGIGTTAVEIPLVFETMRNCSGGHDSFRDPIELGPEQSQSMINVFVRDLLKARTRPGADGLGAGAPGGTNPIQGLLYFDTPSLEYLVAASNGNLYTWNNTTWSAALSWTMATTTGRLAAAQGVDKALFSDGVGNLQSWDGTTFTDLGSSPGSPPVGATILLWHAGRMWASGVASAPDTIWPSALLDFGVGAWDNNRSFRVGGGEGDPIRALASMQANVMVVGKEFSVWLVETDPQKVPSSYAADQPTEALSYGIGICGPQAWCVYGNDLLFVSPDLQIRTVKRMAAAARQFELSSPLSVPVQTYIDRINPNYTHLIAATKYQEFALFAVPLDTSTYNNAVLVWNGRLGQWLGCWEGWTPTCWTLTRFSSGSGKTGVARLVFGDQAGYVNQWKDRDASDDDDTYTDNGVGYASKLWTRSMVFGDLEAPKQGFNGIVRFNQGNARVQFVACGSDADLRTAESVIEPTGDTLGTDDLPFLLASAQPTVARFSLRGLPSFNELFLKIESTSGWWELRNLTLSARVRPLKQK